METIPRFEEGSVSCASPRRGGGGQVEAEGGRGKKKKKAEWKKDENRENPATKPEGLAGTGHT